MNKRLLASLLLMTSLALSGCSKADVSDSPAPFEGRWGNSNFDIITAAGVNYTTTDIFDGYILPLDKNDIDYGSRISGGAGTKVGDTEWSGTSRGSKFAWDFRWAVPKKFKIWWKTTYDQEAYLDASKSYDQYTNKSSSPGTAWCEAEIEIRHPSIRDQGSYLNVYFFPDGHVEGDIEYSDGVLVDINKRNELPVLKAGQHCIKEIPNPYYGKKEPIHLT